MNSNTMMHDQISAHRHGKYTAPAPHAEYAAAMISAKERHDRECHDALLECPCLGSLRWRQVIGQREVQSVLPVAGTKAATSSKPHRRVPPVPPCTVPTPIACTARCDGRHRHKPDLLVAPVLTESEDPVDRHDE